VAIFAVLSSPDDHGASELEMVSDRD